MPFLQKVTVPALDAWLNVLDWKQPKTKDFQLGKIPRLFGAAKGMLPLEGFNSFWFGK